MRLPKVTIKERDVIAQAAYIPPRTLIRTWIMQRREAKRQNRIPAIGADSPGRHTPNAGATHTPNGVSADAD